MTTLRTPVLTDEEALACVERGMGHGCSYVDIVREAEQSVLARAGADAVRDAALEEAAHECEMFAVDWKVQALGGDNSGASDHKGSAADELIEAIRALKGTPAAACISCGGPGWYTSHTTGYGHWVPCRRCNPDGKHAAQPSSNPGPLAAVERDAARWAMLQTALHSRLPGPGWGRRFKVVETSPMHGDDKDVTGLTEIIDAAIAASKGDAS